MAKAPDPQHRLLADLAFSAFEARHYPAFLSAAARAAEAAPRCPRSLWAYACALQASGHLEEAVAVYRTVIGLGMRWIPRSCCCRHKAHARGLIADCFFHLSQALKASGHLAASGDAFIAHLDLRGPGCYSIYRLAALPVGTSIVKVRRPVV